MADWALYLDESGGPTPHSLPVPHGQTPVFTLAGIALPLAAWREYDREYLTLKSRFFENEIEASTKSAHSWEFKGNRIIAPRNAQSDRNRAFGNHMFGLTRAFHGRLFGVTFLKNPQNPTAASSMYTVALQILAEKFDIFLRELRSSGVIIMDSRMAHVTPGRGLDYQVANSFLSFVFGHNQGRQMKCLQEAPLFADSAHTAGVQMADIIAALLFANMYQEHLAPNGADPANGYLDYTHTKSHWRNLSDLEFRSDRVYAGYKAFGFRTLDHRKKKQA